MGEDHRQCHAPLTAVDYVAVLIFGLKIYPFTLKFAADGRPDGSPAVHSPNLACRQSRCCTIETTLTVGMVDSSQVHDFAANPWQSNMLRDIVAWNGEALPGRWDLVAEPKPSRVVQPVHGGWDMKTYDVVVVGGGLAGLTSAAALSSAGKKVVVLEQYSVVGGSTHVFRRKGKWEWQVGVHHLADCGPNGDMPTVFRGLGLEESITYLPMDRTGHERYVFPDLEFDAPADWDEFIVRISNLFPEERRTIAKFIKVLRKTAASVDRATSTASIGGMAKAGLKLGLHAPLATMSASAVMDRYQLSARLQTLLTISPCGSLNCPPDRFPFVALATFWNLFVTGGAWFPSGGGQVFSANLLRVIEQYGGEVVTGAFAEEILVENGKAAGVRLRGGATYRAAAVISTADIKKTYNNLIPADAMTSKHSKRVNDYRMATPFFNAFLGVDIDLATLYPNRDHFSMPTWTSYGDIERLCKFRAGDTAESWMERVQPVIGAYVHCSNMKDPVPGRYAPEGSSSLEVMFPIRMDYRMWGAEPVDVREHEYKRSETYSTIKEFLTDVMIDRATDVLPEIDGHIVHREAATPITQERYTQSTGGSSYGIEWNTHQSALLRPGAKTHIEGLYLAGASCRPGPATEGVLLSGIITAGTILGRDLLAEFRAGKPLVPAGTIPATPQEWDPLSAAKPRRAKVAKESGALTAKG
ncbi:MULTISPECIES: phytoene desaturase family protein [Nocardiaceae]|uniref:phytoene desaturase family protein n=1 Tax=Nocardiaceae TaxID=85025 RepID=UPI00114069D5|nr:MULTISPECIES: NAD(P)/FAD-dependent oxidoreductase [Rhodococcus]